MKNMIAACAGGIVAIAALNASSAVTVSGWGELGFLSVIDHTIQFSKDGTEFDYDDDGGQDVLFPFSRLSVDINLGAKHTVVFLYQPLRIETEALLDDSLLVDELVFEPGTPARFTYSFPFYRLSYLYNLTMPERFELGIGLSLQIRNATIAFASQNGEQYRDNRDVGPVPALKLRGSYAIAPQWRLGIEADGIYAPISYLNGSDNDVTGAILDAAFRAMYAVKEPLELYASARYLGGGAEGTSEDDGPGDGYVSNWLHFFIVSLGFHYRF